MGNVLKRLALSLLLLVLSSCGLHTPVEHQFSIDGIKIITPAITQGSDKSAFLQNTYALAPDRRLLLRFESFSQHTDRVDVSGGKKVVLEMTAANDFTRQEAARSFRLCPLVRNWMMAATWRLAHPFGADGRWVQPGGDFEDAGCVAPPAPAAGDTSRRMTFDVTAWFVNYARGRGINYGWVLLASDRLDVIGETSGAQSPRMIFDRFR